MNEEGQKVMYGVRLTQREIDIIERARVKCDLDNNSQALRRIVREWAESNLTVAEHPAYQKKQA